jgi:hypothetical protein
MGFLISQTLGLSLDPTAAADELAHPFRVAVSYLQPDLKRCSKY